MDVFSRIFSTLLLLPSLTALAQNDKLQSDKGLSLAQAENDSTASASLLYSGAYNLLDDKQGNTFLIRSALPFELAGFKNIARLTLPVITNSPSGKSGLGHLTIYDIVAFEHSWGRWGIGPVLLAPTTTKDELGADKWAISPALGFVAHSDKLLWGVFNKNLFIFAGNDEREAVEASVVQPIINYSLANNWSIGSSEMNTTLLTILLRQNGQLTLRQSCSSRYKQGICCSPS